MRGAHRLRLRPIAYLFLLAVYAFSVIMAATSADTLYGGGRILSHVTAAWVWEALPWLVACSTAFVLARFRAFRRNGVQLAIMMVVSGALSIWLVMQPLSYSLDVLRYLWDGRLLAHGVNPYAYVPQDPHLHSLQQWPYWGWMGWKNWPEAYPPLAQIYFGAIALFTGGTVVQYKLWMLLNGAVSVWLFHRVLAKRRAAQGGSGLTEWDRQRFNLFLLLPPLIVEAFGSAHVDAFAIPWMLLAWLYRLQNQPKRMAVAIAMATCIKTYPIVLLAAFLHRENRREAVQVVAVCLLTIAVSYGLFAGAGWRVFAFFTKMPQMEYNGSLEYTLAKAFGSVISNHATLLVALAALGMASALWFTRLRHVTVERKVCLLGLAFLLSSPVLHPWYLLPLLPFAVVADDAATLWLAVFSHLIADEVPLDMYLEYVPTYGLLLRQLRVYWVNVSTAAAVIPMNRSGSSSR